MIFLHKQGIEHGFSLIELMVVIGMMLILMGIGTVSLLSIQHQSTLSSTVEILLGDIREQQIKAMTGDTEGRPLTDTYGLYFETNKYILFHGTYVSNDPDNFVVNLDPSLQFSSISLPSSQIIFAKGSGEFSNYVNGQNSFTLNDTLTNKQTTVTINQLGVISGIN